jgi:taurine dioxygenase
MGNGMITVKKLTASIGVEIGGVDLSQPLSPETVAVVKQAYKDNLVVFFRDQQPLDDETHCRVGRYFGTLDLSEIQPTPRAHKEILVLDQVSPKGEGADRWHRDRTYLEAPPQGSILQCVQRADLGGDTCWASMYAAYDALSAPMRNIVDNLTARHSIERLASYSKKVSETLGDRLKTWPTTIHPLVEVHPDTGRKALNVNANWTAEIVGMTHTESEALLTFLFDHVKSPEFQVRFTWKVNDVAFWDNRCCLHYAVADYTSRRIMKRVALVGHKPVGPNG